MNDKQRSYWIKRHMVGNDLFCKACGLKVFATFKPQAIVDHIDNDSTNNYPGNIQILCRSCNRIKNPNRKYKPASIRTQSEITNQRAEPRWRDWVTDKVLNNEDQGFEIEEAINSGAELFSISVDTIARRYLPKLTSQAGKFIVEEDRLFLKSMIIKKRGDKSIIDILKERNYNPQQ